MEAEATGKPKRTRTSNGEASYRKRPDGLWEGRFTDSTDKRRSVYGKTRKIVVDKVKYLQKQEAEGKDLGAKRLRVSEYLDLWLEQVAEPRVRAKTLQSYKGIIEGHLKPALGKHWLDELTPAQVQKMLNDRRKEVNPKTEKPRLSARTVQYMQAVLRTALAQALKWGWVTRNVATLVEPPRLVRTQIKPLTPVQTGVLLTATREDMLGPLYAVAVSTGLRQGELLGLEWKDVDLVAGTLTVRQALSKDAQGTWKLVEPKSQTSRRTIPLPAVAVEALERQRTRQKESRRVVKRLDGSWNLVFLSSTGTPLDGHNVTHRLQAALLAAGLPKQRFHDLRHACATYLIAAGVQPRTVMEILGHSQISLTMNTYAHVSQATAREAANAMDRVLGQSA